MSNKFNIYENNYNYEDNDLLNSEAFQKNQDINFVKYKIYNINNNNNNNNNDQLNEILNFINQNFIKNYIWQKEPFNLKFVNNNKSNNNKSGNNSGSNNKLQSYYYGKTKFEELIDDEWFIVYILIELSKKYEQLIISVKDNDGEFLLIETSKTLPKWVKPTNTRNRVFIKNGKLNLIPLPADPSQLDEIPYKMDIDTAINILSNNKINTAVSNETTNELNNKLKKFYSGQYLVDQNHISLVYLPIRISYLLKEYPQLISSITTTFYNRDIDDMKSITSFNKLSKILSNNNSSNNINNNNNNSQSYNEYIFTKIRFTRCLYAMLKLQHFNSPRNFPITLPKPSHPTYEAKSLGIKIICGLEMLYQKSKRNHEIEKQNQLNSNDPDKYRFNDDSNWSKYLNNIKLSDYFQNEKEGSKLYKEKLLVLKSNYLKNKQQQNNNNSSNNNTLDSDDNESKLYLLIDEILNSLLLLNEKEVIGQIEKSDSELIESDEQWLNDVPEKFEDLINEFEKEGFGFGSGSKSSKSNKSNKSNNSSGSNSGGLGEEDTINNFSKSFKSMLSQLSSIDGVNIKSNSKDDGVSFDSNKFMDLLKGLTTMDENGIFNNNDDSGSDSDIEDDDMYQDINDYDSSDEDGGNIDNQDENFSDDSSYESSDNDSGENQDESDDEIKYVEFLKKSTSMKSYMKQMDKELNSKIFNHSFEVEPNINQVLTQEEISNNNLDNINSINDNNNNHDNDQDNRNQKVNLDLNLVKNLLESLSEQQGLAGPASNLLREMVDKKDEKKSKKKSTSSKTLSKEKKKKILNKDLF